MTGHASAHASRTVHPNLILGVLALSGLAYAALLFVG